MTPVPTKTIRYSVVALLLGALWFAALLVPSSTGGFLRVSEWWNFQLGFYELLGLMCLASLAVALVFRRLIIRPRTLIRRLVLAALLPFAGSVFFIWLTVLYAYVTGRIDLTSHMYPDVIEVGALMFFMALYGLLWTLWAFYVVIPMGLISQMVMEWVGRDEAMRGQGQAI